MNARDNSGGPAFPVADLSKTQASGITVRDYFALRAPIEVPAWFAHVSPAVDYPALPDVMALDPELQQEATDWLRDGVFELSPALEEFGAAVTAHREGKAAWQDKDRAARYVQWRWDFADRMIAERLEQGAYEKMREDRDGLVKRLEIAVERLQGVSDERDALLKRIALVRTELARAIDEEGDLRKYEQWLLRLVQTLDGVSE